MSGRMKFRWWSILAGLGILFAYLFGTASCGTTTPGYKTTRTTQTEATQQAGRPVIVAVHTQTPIPPMVTNTRKPQSTKTSAPAPTSAPTARPTAPATQKPTVAATAVPTAEPTQPPAPTAAPTNPPAPTQPPESTAIPPTVAPATEVPPPPTDVSPPPTEVPPLPTEVPPLPTDVPPPPPPVGNVVIAGVYNEGKVERVTLTNQGGDADLSGWSVSGSRGDDRYTFPGGYVLPAGQSVRLHSGEGGVDAPPYDIYWTTKTVWNNDGETVFLWDAQGNKVHELTYH